MRPVNLIPADQRRGRGPSSRGNLATKAILGALVLVLLAASAIAFFDKKVSNRQVEIDTLKAQVDSAQAQASSFSSFTSFQQIHDARLATIDSLAKSRFDWERVMRELAIVIPERVYLTNLTGTVSPEASVTNGAGLSVRGSIPGPAFEMTGCARNQRTVARMIAAMHDIDGVGRVLVSNSAKSAPPEATDGAAPSAAPTDSSATGCGARPTYPTFELVAAFDGVPTADATATIDPSTGVPTTSVTPPATAGATTTPTTPGATTTPTTPPTATTTPTTTPATTTADGGVAAATDQNAAQQGEIAGASESANAAAQIPSGGK